MESGLSIRRHRETGFNKERLKRLWNQLDTGRLLPIAFIRQTLHFFDQGTHENDIEEELYVEEDSEEEQENHENQQEADPLSLNPSQNEEISQDLANADECRICLTPNETSVCLVPCGHNRMCQTCAERIAQETNRCPICRTTLTLTVRMY